MLDPHLAQLLGTMAGPDAPAASAGTAVQARADFAASVAAVHQVAALAPVRSVDDRTLPGGRAVRVYRPEVDGPVPTIVFFHGGGWVIGSIETHDDQARLLCRDVGAVVVSVDYRLAPEHPFPAGLEDCLAATRWAGAHRDELGGDDRLVVAGDSAGGNLAASVALLCRQDGPALAAQLLVYPPTDLVLGAVHPSRVENAEGFFLTTADMEWFIAQLLPAGTDPRDPRASVLHAADLSGLPPAVVVTAEFDPLRDEGEAYARALDAAGVPVTLRRFEGMTHGFCALGALSPAAAAATAQVCADLSALLQA